MMNIDTSSKKEQRKFGIVMAIAFALLGTIRWFLSGGEFHFGFLFVSLSFLVIGLVAPKVLQPLLVVWLRIALVLNWIVIHVALTLVWWMMITPIRLLIRLFSDDPMNRQWLPDDETYWEEPDAQPDDLESYTKQF